MTYYSGFVTPVPQANRQAYLDFSRKAWPFFRKYGARRSVECWGEDLPRGQHTDFYRAVDAQDGETVLFSWVEWPDRATCDAGWQAIMADPEMAEMGEMPFDGARMFWGGFAPIFAEGDSEGGWYQGFILAVPEANRDAYLAMAREAWEGAFRPKGCLGMFENWGEDVPRGKRTDFWRAVKAEEGEAVLMVWTVWPDRATCEAASAAMEAEWQGKPMPAMPFDGSRMFWGGFSPIFDERA